MIAGWPKATARWWVVTVVAVTMMVAGGVPLVRSRLMVNLASLGLLDLRLAAGQPGVYPFSDLAPGQEDDSVSSVLSQQIAHLYQAGLKADKRDCAAWWGLARLALLRRDLMAAQKAMQSCQLELSAHAFGQIDLLAALSDGGPSRELIDVYERRGLFRPGLTPRVGDALALSYLEYEDDVNLETRLKHVLDVRPSDLYAHYQLNLIEKKRGSAQAEEHRRALRTFSQEAINPSDARLLDYAVSIVPALVQDGEWSSEQAKAVVSFLVYKRTDWAAVESLQQLAAGFSQEADWAAYLGDWYAQRQAFDAALEAYKMLASSHPDYARAYLRLGQIQEQRCRVSGESDVECLVEATGWYERFHELAPQGLLGLFKLAAVCAAQACNSNPWRDQLQDILSARQPRFLLNPTRRQLANGWTLLGYDTDEERLVRGEPTDLWLYWLPPSQPQTLSRSPRKDWLDTDGRVVQVIEFARNLAPNGGFELGVENTMPASYSDAFYHAPPGSHSITVENRERSMSHVALLEPRETRSAALVSIEVPVSPDNLYLEASWIKSTGTGAYLGRYWVGAKSDPPYDYAALNTSSPEWSHWAGLATPLPGTTACQVMLLNTDEYSQVYFDNILLVPIDEPDGSEARSQE